MDTDQLRIRDGLTDLGLPPGVTNSTQPTEARVMSYAFGVLVFEVRTDSFE